MKLILEQSSEKELMEAMETLYKLRVYTKFWHENGGYQNKMQKNQWEIKADVLIKRILNIEV